MTVSDQNQPRVVVLVPSISAHRLSDARTWLTAMRDAGFDTRVVANGATAYMESQRLLLHAMGTGSNPGFARSINSALEQVEGWDWLLLLNDDVDVEEGAAQAIRDALRDAEVAGTGVVFLGTEPDRPLPGTWGVFTSLSLLSAVRSHFPHAARRDLSRTYRSFSAVAISASAWSLVGGLDRRYVFCYEDADFIRRYRGLGGAEPLRVDAGFSHQKSASTGQHIAGVLPAIAYSADTYLRAVGVGCFRASAVVILALVVRSALTPFAGARIGQHLRGIARSIRCIVLRHEPSLPTYDQL
ncbi:glycosyltransferase family protein [Microbacterium testaceum]|uniref:hypothetical protein n=1 Tax=Microbacterium testaceum TaxID=2033 RepID=UPI002AC644CA|nr:hypothetical protein [Microbacterium testaceum]MDZ5146133.1 hypothetical protein [Microbacterium testaceum]